MTYKTLEILYSHSGESVSGEEMAKTLGVTRAAIKKDIDKLVYAGYNISAVKKSGYTLNFAGDIFDENSLKMFLDLKGINIDTLFFGYTDSTNTQAKKQFFKSNEGVVAAACQTGGKGRLGRKFFSPEGGLYMTYYCRPLGVSPFDAVKTVICAAAAVFETLKKYGADCGIKWANDIFCGGKKICGILCEMLCESENAEYIIQGIGINVNNESFENGLNETATSLYKIRGKKFNRAEVCAEVVFNLIKYNNMLFDGNFGNVLEIYRQNCLTLNNEVFVNAGQGFSGYAKGIDNNGFLIVKTENGEKTINYGDVSVKIKG